MKKQKWIIGLLVCAMSLTVAGCGKKETGPVPDVANYPLTAYVGEDVYFEIPAQWSRIAMEGNPNLMVFAQSENRPATGFNNVTFQVLERPGMTTTPQLTIEEAASGFQYGFETMVKEQRPTAKGFSYRSTTVNGIPVYMGTYVDIVNRQEVVNTVFYPLVEDSRVVFTTAQVSADGPDPQAVARYMIQTMRLTQAS